MPPSSKRDPSSGASAPSSSQRRSARRGASPFVHLPAPELPAVLLAPWKHLLAQSWDVDVLCVHELGDLLEAQGMPFDPLRMHLDNAYAVRQLALAHTSNDASLRALAAALMDAVQRVGERRDGLARLWPF